MSASSSAGSSAGPDSSGHESSSKEKPSDSKSPETPEKRCMINYEYRLLLPFYSGDDPSEIVKLSYLDLPSNVESTGIAHNLIIRKAGGFFVPCTFKARNGRGYKWPLIPNKARPSSSLVPAKASALEFSCHDCRSNSLANPKVDVGYLNIYGVVPQTKLDEKHTIIFLIHSSNRLYPFCMEFTYSPKVFMQISVDGREYLCCGKPTSTRVKPEDRAHSISITVNYHCQTYVIEHPNFRFESQITFVLDSRTYNIELTDSNMRTESNHGIVSGECYFKTVRDSNGKDAYFFMKRGSDRELIPISQEVEPVFAKQIWSSSDKFKAQVTSLSWVNNTIKVDLEEEYLRFGVSGTVVIQSDNIYRTNRLFKPFLMTNSKAFILEKILKIKILCTHM